MEYPKDINYRFSVEYTHDEPYELDFFSYFYEKPAKFLVFYTILSMVIAVLHPGFGLYCFLAFFVYYLIFYRKRLLKPQRQALDRFTYLHGKDSLDSLTIFSDCIISLDEQSPEKQYSYDDVTCIKETELGYLLVLKYGTGLYFSKNITCHYGDPDFRSFLLARCSNLKHKKIINVSKYREVYKLALIFLPVLAVLCFLYYFSWFFPFLPWC